MKKLPILIFCMIAVGCAKDQVAPRHGNATFSMSPVERGANGGRIDNNTTPAFVLLSIKDSNGNTIMQNKKLSLFAFGQSFESESLELNEGSYKLTLFQILNANDTVIYASPLTGTELASYVTNPLPLSFSISPNQVTEVVPQVLAVNSNDVPQSFGYASFGFEIVSNSGQARLDTLFEFEGYNADCKCILPGSMVVFTYDNNSGVFTKFDIYGNFSAANGWQHNWSHVIEYFPDQSFFRDTNWLIDNDPSIQDVREVYYDNSQRVSSVKLFAGNKTNLLSTASYTYAPNELTITTTIYSGGTVSLKAVYVTDSDGDILTKSQYDINGNLIDVTTYSYDNHINPLALFYPLLTNSEFKHNKVSLNATAPSYPPYNESYKNFYSSSGVLLQTKSAASNGIIQRTRFIYH